MRAEERGARIQERAFGFSCRVVRLCQHLERSGVAKHIGGQLLRSGTSIGANLEEAQGGQSKRDFIAKASIALKEARETLYWLRLIDACELIEPHRLTSLTSEANELVAILTTIVRKARSSPAREQGAS